MGLFHKEQQSQQPPVTVTGGATGAGEAKHFDSGKLGIDQIPASILFWEGLVFSYGERKYGRDNWKGGTAWSKMYGSAIRHLMAWARGEYWDDCDGIDPNCLRLPVPVHDADRVRRVLDRSMDICPVHSGLPHLAQLRVNASFLMYWFEHTLGTDDREVITFRPRAATAPSMTDLMAAPSWLVPNLAAVEAAMAIGRDLMRPPTMTDLMIPPESIEVATPTEPDPARAEEDAAWAERLLGCYCGMAENGHPPHLVRYDFDLGAERSYIFTAEGTMAWADGGAVST